MPTPHSPCTKDQNFVSIQPRLGGLIGVSDPDMEVLGAAAAISQFLLQLIATVGLAKKLKGSSKSLKQYQERLNSLKDLCEDIRNNPALRTEEVRKETQSILHIIDTHRNASILSKKGRFRRAIVFILREQSFVDLFAVLEDKKTNLSLHVLNINCLALHDINLLITSMGPTSSNHGQETPPQTPTEMSQPTELSLSMPASPVVQHTYSKAVYRNNKAGHNINQHVGPHTPMGIVKPGGSYNAVDTDYIGQKKTGGGLQILGLTLEETKLHKESDNLPASCGLWADNEHEGVVEGSEIHKQVAGTYVAPAKDGPVVRD